MRVVGIMKVGGERIFSILTGSGDGRAVIDQVGESRMGGAMAILWWLIGDRGSLVKSGDEVGSEGVESDQADGGTTG